MLSGGIKETSGIKWVNVICKTIVQYQKKLLYLLLLTDHIEIKQYH